MSRRRKVYYYEPHDEIKNSDPEYTDQIYFLWARRLKATLPRLKVLKFLMKGSSKSPASDPEISTYSIEELAVELGMSMATLYRVVEVLVSVGLLRKIKLAAKKIAAKYGYVSARNKRSSV